MRPVTIEDTRVVTHEALTLPDGTVIPADKVWLHNLCEDYLGEIRDLRARLASAETALADRDRHFMWDDRLRMEREIGDLATRLATAEAERAYLADRVDALNGQQDGLMQDRRTAEAERDRLLRQIARVRACPCISGASCDELDTLYAIAASSAPSTGTTPP